jgi:crotonobetainyl-CoA:carnitine CoA-transferase CaiB-like acyl-CoA transferase
VLASTSETKGVVESLGPTLGQHTDDILSGLLGLSRAKIADFKARGVV